MKLVLAITLMLYAGSLAAQATKPPPPASTPNFCDVTYSMDVETTADQDDVSSASITVRANPYQDVAEDHKRQVRILDQISKEQDKGGPYSVTVTETNTCDGGNTVRINTGSIYADGITLEGATRIADVQLQVAREINDRYKSRAKQGAKVGWNHKNAKKVKRDDLGRRIHASRD